MTSLEKSSIINFAKGLTSYKNNAVKAYYENINEECEEIEFMRETLNPFPDRTKREILRGSLIRKKP